MGAKESAEMAKARKLIKEKGLKVIDAAKIAGVSTPAIYMSKWYKLYKEEKIKELVNNENHEWSINGKLYE